MATGTIQVIQNDKKDKWYLTDGLSESDVVAAYQFAFAPSEADALVNINDGTKYTLTKGSNVRWTKCTGFVITDGSTNNNYLDNTTLKGLATDIKACIYGFKFQNYASSGANLVGVGLTDNRWLSHNYNLTSGTQWGFVMNGGNGWKSIGWRCQAGILGCNFDANYIYVNGTKYAASTTINPPYGRNHNIMCHQAGDLGNGGGNIVPALVFYNKALTEEQHGIIAKNIVNLGYVM